LNLELVSLDKEVSTDAVVLVGWIMEICSLLGDADWLDAATSPRQRDIRLIYQHSKVAIRPRSTGLTN
jgi:hypothetical protein